MTLMDELTKSGKVSILGDMCVLWVSGGIIEEGSHGLVLTDEQVESLVTTNV
jgi:hypothetical protein